MPDTNVFSLPINTGVMKKDLQNIPKDELVLRVVACCNEIERERREYNLAVDEINRLKSNYNNAVKMSDILLKSAHNKE